MARDKKELESQPGDVLGIGHIATSVKRESGISPTSTADDAERRRNRMQDGADELVPGDDRLTNDD